MKLLVVCLGNICRSPMGEGALRARLAASPLATCVAVDSAGTGHWHAGEPPDPRAIACAREHGVEIGDLRARQVQWEDFERFDWLLCADQDNLHDLKRLAPPALRHKASLWLPWAGVQAHSSNILDPYTGGHEDFARAWRLVDMAACGTVNRLARAIIGQ